MFTLDLVRVGCSLLLLKTLVLADPLADGSKYMAHAHLYRLSGVEPFILPVNVKIVFGHLCTTQAGEVE